MHHLLYVEDNPADAYLMQLFVKQSGRSITLHHVDNAEAALTYLAGDSSRPERLRVRALIMDLNLPRINGCELIREVRKDRRFAELPIYVQSTSPYFCDEGDIHQLGANRFFPKSFELSSVELMIESICEDLNSLLRTKNPIPERSAHAPS